MTWQCEPGDPRPPFSKSVPSFATMGETQNELRLNKRERGERKGAGVVVKAKGGSEQNAHLGGQREYGDQLPLPLPPRQHGPHPPQNAHTHTHTHGCMRTLLQKRLYILDEESWSSNCGEADQTVLHAFFPSFLFLCLRLFLGALSRIYNRPTFTFVKERLFRGCLKFSPMFLCLVAVFCFCWGFFVYGKCIFFGRGGWRSDCA